MDDFILRDGWQDWVVVFSYLGFTAFIVWGIFNGKQK